MHHIYVKIEHFWRPTIWGNTCWVSTPYCSSWLQSTNFGKQLQNWISFIFIQLQLKGILEKEIFVTTIIFKDDLREFLPVSSSVKYHYKLQFQTAGVSSFILQMLRYFTDTQISIQTAITKKFRQLSLPKGCFSGPQTWLHMTLWNLNSNF